MNGATLSHAWSLASVVMLASLLPASGSGVLTLGQAEKLAVERNHILRAAALGVEAADAKVWESQTRYLPSIKLSAGGEYSSQVPEVSLQPGAFGALPVNGNLVPFPNERKTIGQGNHYLGIAGVTAYQPISQLPRIHAGVEAAKSEAVITRLQASVGESEIRRNVEKAYFGLLIANQQKSEAGTKVELTRLRLSDAEKAMQAGKAIPLEVAGLSAKAMDAEADLCKLEDQVEDLGADLRRMTGLNPGDSISLDTTEAVDPPLLAITQLQAAVSRSLESNPDVRISTERSMEADHGLRAARNALAPEFGLVAGYSVQSGFDFFPAQNATVGLLLEWDLEGLLSKSSQLRQQHLVQSQAHEKLEETNLTVRNAVGKAWRKLEQSRRLAGVARKALEYRTSEFTLQSDRFRAGLSVRADFLASLADLEKAKADLWAASLGGRTALTDLNILLGLP